MKTTDQYVCDLKEKLECVGRLTRENFQKASKRHKNYCDRTTRFRKLQVGDKVLVLLPRKQNKLLIQWKGPFDVVEVYNKLDYRINMRSKKKTFNIYLLRKYCDIISK